PAGQYGGGTVSIWDRGTYENRMARKAVPQTVSQALDAGHLEFTLHGEKLRGNFALVRMKARGGGKPLWLLIKMKDEVARPGTSAREAKAEANPTPVRVASPSAPARRPRAAKPPRDVELTHPEKVLFPDAGLTKGDVFAYYERIADRLLPYLTDRPAT